MTLIGNFFAVTFGIFGELLLAPFITFFGLLMLGMAFGLSLIAAGAMTASKVRNESLADRRPGGFPLCRTGAACARRMGQLGHTLQWRRPDPPG